MKRSLFFSLLILLAVLISACQADDPALSRVKSAIRSYQDGNSNLFERQLTNTKRFSSLNCPDKLQTGCMQVVYKNFAAQQQASVQSPALFTFSLYEKQTTPEIKMVLVEGNWGGSPAIISCQVFFVLNDGAYWLIDNYDEPQAMTCRQRSEELTENLFGSAATP